MLNFFHDLGLGSISKGSHEMYYCDELIIVNIRCANILFMVNLIMIIGL